jgi:hypothetical protein
MFFVFGDLNRPHVHHFVFGGEGKSSIGKYDHSQDEKNYSQRTIHKFSSLNVFDQWI